MTYTIVCDFNRIDLGKNTVAILQLPICSLIQIFLSFYWVLEMAQLERVNVDSKNYNQHFIKHDEDNNSQF